MNLILLISIYIHYATSTNKILTQKGVCSAETEEGLIDLSPLSTGKTPRFSGVGADGYMYHYDPCRTFNIAGTTYLHCDNTLACQEDKSNDYYYPLDGHTGKFEQANEQLTKQAGIVIAYSATGGDSTERRLQTLLICGDEVKFEPVGSAVHLGLDYVFKLTAPECCPGGGGGLSFGSILLIVASVLLIVYLLGGAGYLRWRHAATGSELIVNKSFWVSLPGLVKDGAVFVKNKGKVTQNYAEV